MHIKPRSHWKFQQFFGRLLLSSTAADTIDTERLNETVRKDLCTQNCLDYRSTSSSVQLHVSRKVWPNMSLILILSIWILYDVHLAFISVCVYLYFWMRVKYGLRIGLKGMSGFCPALQRTWQEVRTVLVSTDNICHDESAAPGRKCCTSLHSRGWKAVEDTNLKSKKDHLLSYALSCLLVISASGFDLRNSLVLPFSQMILILWQDRSQHGNHVWDLTTNRRENKRN